MKTLMCATLLCCTLLPARAQTVSAQAPDSLLQIAMQKVNAGLMVGENPGEGFGIGISDAGDVNRDGFDDLVVGAWQNASAAPSGGKLFIHSGHDGSLLFEITGKVAGETFGFDSTGMGDVDGDGYVDFLITSAYSMKNGFQSGRTLILSGNPGENHGRH